MKFRVQNPMRVFYSLEPNSKQLRRTDPVLTYLPPDIVTVQTLVVRLYDHHFRLALRLAAPGQYLLLEEADDIFNELCLRWMRRYEEVGRERGRNDPRLKGLLEEIAGRLRVYDCKRPLGQYAINHEYVLRAVK